MSTRFRRAERDVTIAHISQYRDVPLAVRRCSSPIGSYGVIRDVTPLLHRLGQCFVSLATALWLWEILSPGVFTFWRKAARLEVKNSGVTSRLRLCNHSGCASLADSSTWRDSLAQRYNLVTIAKRTKQTLLCALGRVLGEFSCLKTPSHHYVVCLACASPTSLDRCPPAVSSSCLLVHMSQAHFHPCISRTLTWVSPNPTFTASYRLTTVVQASRPYMVFGQLMMYANIGGSSKKLIVHGVSCIGYMVGNLIGPHSFVALEAPSCAYKTAYSVFWVEKQEPHRTL